MSVHCSALFLSLCVVRCPLFVFSRLRDFKFAQTRNSKAERGYNEGNQRQHGYLSERENPNPAVPDDKL